MGKNLAHIGAGDYNKQHVEETNKFFKKYGGKVTKTVGRPIRLATPNMCKPFYKGKVVGVGESIGTVYPLLGEGIIPSMMLQIFLLKILVIMKVMRKKLMNISRSMEKFSIL